MDASKQMAGWRNWHIAVALALAVSVCLNICLLLRGGPSAPVIVDCNYEPVGTYTLGVLPQGESLAGREALAQPVHARQLAPATGSAATAASASSASTGIEHRRLGGGSGPHNHDALVFMFLCLVIGTGIMHLNSKFPSMQLTVVLFVLGIFFSLIFEGAKFKDKIGVFGDSYDMWMEIDPHLLLFTLLPALLAGDAMTIDTSVARRVGYQCLYLAGPGVVIQASVVASFLYAYWAGEWDFELCLITGCISGMLPVALSLLPQRMEIDVSKLEPQFQNLKNAKGEPITKVFANKGL